MKIIITFVLLYIKLFANTLENKIDIEFVSILHNELEQSMREDTNSFTSLYTHLLVNYDINEDVFFSTGAKINKVIFEENYTTPLYLRTKQTANDINTAIISEASLNYDDGFFALNLGRQHLNYDWLLGSVDGILAMLGDDENYSFRFFWFENYYHLQYNYYMEIEDINAKKGMYGTIAKANFGDIEFSYFNYFVQDLRNIIGVHLNYIYNNIGLNISYTSAKALSLAAYDYDEEFLNISLEFLIQRHFFELGFSQTGENGLLAMLQMGNFMFGQFYLSNQVDRENAKNSFLKYIYANEKWRFELISGINNYDNSFIKIQNNMNAYETDLYLKYNYSKNLSFDLGVMQMSVDKSDPLQVDQSLLMFNMVINYESY